MSVDSTGVTDLAARAVREHHRDLAAQLSRLAETIHDAAADGDDVSAEAVALFGWCRTELLPHLRSEAAALLSRGRERESTAMTVRALTHQADRLRDTAEDLDSPEDPVAAAVMAATVRTLFELHAWQIDDQLIPALLAAGVDVGSAVEGMPELVGGAAIPKAVAKPAAPENAGSGAAEAHAITGLEEIDVRPLPHQGRHNVIFGKLQELSGQGELVIVNDHDPKPLRYQTDALWPGQFEWSYLEEGPEVWRVRIVRA